MRAMVLAFLLLGCGGRTEDAAGVDAGGGAATDAVAEVGVTLEAACARRADALCRDFATCAGLALRRWYADEAACRAGERHTCQRDAALPGIVDPVPKLLACAESLPKEPCGFRGYMPTLFCGPEPTRGTLEDGVACWFDEQCNGGLCSWVHGSSTSPTMPPSCGRCARFPAVGDACAPEVDWPTACDPGSTTVRSSNLVCDPVRSTCVPRASAGEPCAFRNACAWNHVCRDGRCVAPIARIGDPCGSEPCAEGFCDGDRCTPWSEAYGALWPTLVGVGEECDDERRLCAAGAWCSSTRDGAVCVAPTGLGEKCLGNESCGHLAACVMLDGKPRTCLDRRPLCLGS